MFQLLVFGESTNGAAMGRSSSHAESSPKAAAGEPAEVAQVHDPLELEFFRYAVESVVEELEISITRTAYNVLVYEYKDYCVGVVTKDFRLLSQSRHSLPIFLSDLGAPVQDAVAVIGEDRIEAGDVFLTNYAEVQGQHLNNVIAATPVYTGGQIIGYLAVRMHWSDVGGSNPVSVTWSATNVLQEGVQYRGIKIMSRGKIVPEALATIQANSWAPAVVTGDLMAQVGALQLGARRWRERVADRWDFITIDSLIEQQFDSSAQLSRSRIASLPDGEYSASVKMDDSGAPGTPQLELKLTIRVNGERMMADLSELPPQVPLPINAGTTGGAVSAMRVGFKSLLAPERPADEGLFQPLEVVIPPRTVLSATNNAPLSWYNTTLPTMIDLFLRAIGEQLPSLVPAGHHGAFWGMTLAGQDDDGAYWTYLSGANGGFGGSEEADGFGPLRTLMHGDNPDIPLEIIEAQYPVRFHRQRILREAGGAGLHRGGAGLERVVELLKDSQLSTYIDRTDNPAWGLAGGEPGQPAAIHVKLPGSETAEPWGKKAPTPVPAGTMIYLRGGGGGGWGRPDRDGPGKNPGGGQ
jgi:N-methylhydantoinase B